MNELDLIGKVVVDLVEESNIEGRWIDKLFK